MIQYPPVIGVSELAELLKKSPAAILADRSRAPHRLPPSCNPPGTRRPLWILEDVISWLQQYQQPAAAPAPSPATAPTPRRGRPTKAEQVKAARLGISVSDMRRQQE